MGRRRRAVASSPCLRFSPPEVFAQRLLQPVPSCIFLRQMASPAFSFIAVIRHHGPISNASRLTPSLCGYGYRPDILCHARRQSPIRKLGRDFADLAHGAVVFPRFSSVTDPAARPHGAAREFADPIGNRIGPQSSQRSLLSACRANFGRFGCPTGRPRACASRGLVARIGAPVEASFGRFSYPGMLP
jgi:hypothetical protein